MNTSGSSTKPRGPVPRGFAQIPDHLSIVAQHEAPLCERGARYVAGEMLQRLPVGGGDARGGMQ